MEEKFKEYRCDHCGKLFFKANLLSGSKVEIKCKRCGHLISIKENNHDGSGKKGIF